MSDFKFTKEHLELLKKAKEKAAAKKDNSIHKEVVSELSDVAGTPSTEPASNPTVVKALDSLISKNPELGSKVKKLMLKNNQLNSVFGVMTPRELENRKAVYSDLMSEYGDKTDEIATQKAMSAAMDQMLVTGAGIRSGNLPNSQANRDALDGYLNSYKGRLKDIEHQNAMDDLNLKRGQAAYLQDRQEQNDEAKRVLDAQKYAYEKQQDKEKAQFDQSKENRQLSTALGNLASKLRSDKTHNFAELVEQSRAFSRASFLLNQVEKGNTASIAPLGIILAKAFGERGVMTDSDVKRYIMSAKWANELRDWLSKGAQGTLSKETIKHIRENIGGIKSALMNDYNKSRGSAIKSMRATFREQEFPSVGDDRIQDILMIPRFGEDSGVPLLLTKDEIDASRQPIQQNYNQPPQQNNYQPLPQQVRPAVQPQSAEPELSDIEKELKERGLMK